MNSSCFIYFYLHLANQKTQSNLILNNHVSSKYSNQPLYAKQSLTLLSLKGLKKKSDLFNEAALTAWKQALGYPDLVSLPFFSLHQLYQLNLKYKALVRFQNLNFSKKKQSTEENFFSIARKSNKKAAFLPFSLLPNFKFKQLTLPACFGSRQSEKTKVLDKVKIKRKLISTLYQKILNQSFKKTFIDHLKKIENLTKIKTYGKPKFLNPSRLDHQMELFSWTPSLDKNETYSNVSKAATSNNLGKNFYKIQRAQENEFKKPFSGDLKTAENALNFCSKHESLRLKQLFFAEKAKKSCLASNCGNGLIIEKNTAKKINTSLVDYDKNKNLPFENYMMLSNLSLNNPVQKKELKTFFDFLQLETVKVRQDLSTKFLCASWLLDFIRAELSIRNANLKRVLNNIFLHTRQPICNFTQSKQAVPLALPFQKSSEKANWVFVNSKNSLFVVPDIIKGLRVTFSGRLGGKKGMAKTLTKTTGRVPLSTLKEKVDFAKGVVHTKNGSLGIKVWICFN